MNEVAEVVAAMPEVEVKPTAGAAAAPIGDEARAAWGRVVRSCGIESPILRAILTNSALAAFEDDRAVLDCKGFASGAKKNLGTIAAAFSRELGRPVSVGLVGDGTAQGTTASSSAPVVSAPAPEAQPAVDKDRAVEDPLVRQTIELFGARVVDVQPRRG